MKKLVSAEVKSHYAIVDKMHESKPFYKLGHAPKNNGVVMDGLFTKPQTAMGCDVELPLVNSF